MAALTLPGIRDLDLPLGTTNWSYISPPLTPTTQSFCSSHGSWQSWRSSTTEATPPLTPITQSFCSSHGGWQSRKASMEQMSCEALTALSRSALYQDPSTYDDQSRRSSTVSTSPSEQLPSFTELLRAVSVCFPYGHGAGRLPTPAPSPICQSPRVPGSPEPEQSVPWSRSRLPDDEAASQIASILRTRRQESRIASAQTIRSKAALPGKQRHQTNAGVMKTKTAKKQPHDKKEKKEKKRNNQEYTPIQECFIIYHKSERKFGWAQIEEVYNKWNRGSGEPHRSLGALSCIYYRTNYRIPATTPDGLLDLRWEYGEQVEAEIQMYMETEAKRLEEERRREEEEAELLERQNGTGTGSEDKLYDEWTNSEREPETTEQKDKKKKKQKKIEVPYPFSVHGDAGIPAVEYRNSSTKVREGGDVLLMHRFPEVLADERNTWVLPEHRAQAQEIAARRMQQRLEWREWMEQHHPQELLGLDKKKKGFCSSPYQYSPRS